MGNRQAVILGILIAAGTIGHALISTIVPNTIVPKAPSQPLWEGYAVGSIIVGEKESSSTYKCNGSRVECYDTFVLVHIDKSKEPTWHDNYVLAIPWQKIKHMMLLPYPPEP